MSFEIILIMGLHSFAAAVALIRAMRDRLPLAESLRWGGIGFMGGMLGLIARFRTNRNHIHYMHMVQDTVLNFVIEVFALYGLPRLLG